MRTKKTFESAPWATPPDALPSGARDLWPDISKWPTPSTLAELASARQRRPADYLAVINGLRWHTTGDQAPVWSLLTAWLAVAAILLAAMSASFGDWAMWTAGGLGAMFTGLLIRLGPIVDAHIERKRHAAVWLAAVERAQVPRVLRRSFWWRHDVLERRGQY